VTNHIKTESLPEQLRKLTDDDLHFQIQMLTRGEQRMTLQILHHLNEIGRRRLFLGLGYASLFDYCVRKLKYSPSAAGRRIQAARCIRHHPVVLDLLRDREASLSAVALIEPILTVENRDEILDRVRGASHREVERIVCEYRPPVSFRDRVRPVRVAVPGAVDVDRALFERDLARTYPHVTPGAGSKIEQRLLVQFLASEAFMAKFERAQALLSHRCPDNSFAEVLDILLTEFLEQHSPAARQKRREQRAKEKGAEPTPRKDETRKRVASPDSRRREWNTAEARSRYISPEVRDEVYARHDGRCAYVARDGTRCGSRRAVQVDHIRPFAAGGTNESSNLRLLCAAHNRWAAERALGVSVMQRFWRKE